MNRIEFYLIRTETGERTLMGWFLGHNPRYTCHSVQGSIPDGKLFMLQLLSEVRDAAQRERLQPDYVLDMHTPKTPWPKVLAAIEEV